MRIAIDARPASHPQPGGFKRYTEQLLQALAHADTQNQYLVYFDRAPARDFFAGNRNFKPVLVPSSVPGIGVIWREQRAVPHRVQLDAADMIHFTANTGARYVSRPAVVTMHDIIFWEERPLRSGVGIGESIKRLGMFWYNRWAARAALERAQHLITVSKYSKQKIIDRFGIAPERVSAIYTGLSKSFHPLTEHEKDAARGKYGLNKPFLLALCSASPRKNTRGLLEAYAALDPDVRSRYELVLVWTHDLWKAQLMRFVQERGLETRVRSLENIGDKDLAELMNLATAFLFPSLEEGFGIPPLEAMACGTPVVASNRASLPEVLGDAAILTDVTEPGALAQSIAGLIDNPLRLAEYRARGPKWTARYSWANFARETINVYQECV